MFKIIDKNDIDSALNFSWKLYQSPETTSYPINMTRKQMTENFNKSLVQDDDVLLGYYDGNNLTAVFHYYFIEKENYLQTTGVFIEENYNTVMNAFIDKLKNEYPGYKVVLGFPKENKNANEYCLKNHYNCKESATVMKLRPSEFKPSKNNNCITKVTEENFEEYAPFHDNFFADFFWTSSKLKDVFNNEQNHWYMFYYKINEKIEGCSFIRRYEKDNSLEIYGLDFSPEYKTKENVTALLSYTLKYCFEHINGITEASDFIDDDNTIEIAASEELGFRPTNSYRSYETIL